MLFNRPWRRAPLAAFAPLAVLVATATAQASVTLSGYVYIDRNNDGALAFDDEPNPEYVIPGVTIQLFSIVGLTETLVDSAETNEVGHYEFAGLPPGEFSLRQLQPPEYVDGLTTPGSVRDVIGNLNPPGSDPGFAMPNAITNIELPDDMRGVLFNFGERGLSAPYVSKRYLLGTAPAPPTVGIPEPGSVALAAAAALGVAVGRRRRGDQKST